MTLPILGLSILGTLMIFLGYLYAKQSAQCHGQKEYLRKLSQDMIRHNADLEEKLDSHEFLDHMVKYHSQNDDPEQRALCFNAVKDWIRQHGKITIE